MLVIAGREVRDTRLGTVGGCTAEVFETHHFIRDGFDNLRARDEHVGGLVHHDDEVGDGRRINSTARTWSHDD